MYYAVKFNEQTRDMLLALAESICPIPDDWKIYCDHITIVHSSNENWNELARQFAQIQGCYTTFEVIGYGKSDDAFALMVDCITTNKVSHITVACASGAKPVQSNEITNWIKFKSVPGHSRYFNGYIKLCK